MRIRSGRGWTAGARRRGLFAGALLAGAAAAFAAGPAAAQLRDTTERIAALAAASEVAFSIPAGLLSDALAALGRQARVQISYDPDLVQGKQTQGLAGSFTPEEALRRLLAGTGINWRATGDRTIVLEKPSVGSAMTLDPITVEGAGEKAWGPVEGYVATRSATGTKTDTPLIETPQSISVVTSQQVEAQSAQTINEALRYTPGVVADTRGVASRYDGVMIRGFGSYVGSSQSGYLDGLRLLRNSWYSYTSVDPYRLDRIEVLRGPASVLYGQSNPGGLTSSVSKRPTETPVYEVEIEGGSFDRIQGAFDLGGPLDKEGQFLVRLTGLAHDSDTQIDHTKEQRFLVAPAATWRPTKDTELTLLTSVQIDPESGFYGWVPAQGSVLPNPNGTIPTSFFDGDPSFEHFRRDQYMVGYAFDHRLNDIWRVRQNVRYVHLDIDYKQVYGAGLDADLRTLNRGTARTVEDLDTVAVDSQAELRFDTGSLSHTLLTGLDYYRLMGATDFGFGAAPTLDIFEPDYNQVITAPDLTSRNDEVANQLGIYMQDQVKLGQWVATLGGRRDWTRYETTMTDLATGVGDSSAQMDSAFSGRAGLVYLFRNGLAPYFSYAESFEPVIGTGFGGTPFDPTTGRQFEAGVKYQPEGFPGHVAVAAFDLVQENVLTTDPDPTHLCNGLRCQIQQGEVRSRGVEVEGKAEPLPGLSAIASYSYMDVEVTKDNPNTGGASLAGKRPIFAPMHIASLWADYGFRDGTLAGLGFGAGVRYVGSTYGDAENTFKVPDYAVFDAALRYSFGKLDRRLEGMTLRLNARNLLDKEYVSSCEGLNLCYYGQRRTVLATLNYRW